MRLLKLVGLLAGLTLAICALAPAIASAIKPEFLDGTVVKLTFSGESKTTTIEGPELKLTCGNDKTSGETTGEKTLKITFDLEKCKESGLAVNSLGDAKETILFMASGELCYINEKEKIVGVYFKLPGEGLHVEDPAVGVLELYKESFIGKVSFPNILQALQDISFTKANVTKCGPPKELKEASLTFSFNESTKPATAEVESLEELHFTKDIEIMG